MPRNFALNDTLTKGLSKLAVDHIGDGLKPNWYLVTRQGKPVMWTTDGPAAYREWYQIAHGVSRIECALEDRLTGCIASVEPIEDGGTVLGVYDDHLMGKALSHV